MSQSRVGVALRQLSELFHGRRAGERADGQLLERFLRDRDETAFAALVQRHGGLVLGVCRRILGNTHDAEDAFQACFLVLVRRAPAIRHQESLASWLYGVAHRTALKARTAAARRRSHERQAAMSPTAGRTSEPTWDDLRPVLDEELGRLPERYRTPLVLCYLEGKSKEEAARELDCPPGTVSSRLVRGRELLRGRLAQRGVTLSALGLVVLLEQNTAAAGVSAGLALATLQAALCVTAGKPAGVSASILALTEGVLQAMLLGKIRITVLAIAVPLLLLAGGAVTYGVLVQEKGGAAPSDDKTPAKADDKPLTDEQLIQGTWRHVIHNEVTGRVLYEVICVFKGDKYWYIPNGKEIGPLPYQLDTTQKPKAIDLFLSQPRKASDGTKILFAPCIYELQGDTLKLVKTRPEHSGTGFRPLERPTSLEQAQVFKREAPGAKTDQPKQAAATDKIRQINRLKRDAADEVVRLLMDQFDAGRANLEDLLLACRRCVDAELELDSDRQARLKVLSEHFKRMQKIEEIVKLRVQVGSVAQWDYATARYYRYEAEQWLEQEKAK